MKPYTIDKLDLDILEILEENCALTYGDIADRLGKNIWTVRDRMVLLKQREILKGCRAVIDYTKLGMGCRAIISFNIPPVSIDDFIKQLKQEKRIKRFILTTGSRRFHIQIIGANCEEIRNFAKKLLTPFDIENIDFEIILDEIP